MIDNKILLKEIPIFSSGKDVMVWLSVDPVAACPQDLDLSILNRMVYHFRELIEMAIIEEFRKQRNGTFLS